MKHMSKHEAHNVALVSSAPSSEVGVFDYVHPACFHIKIDRTTKRPTDREADKEEPPEVCGHPLNTTKLGQPEGVDDDGGEDEEPHVSSKEPRLANTETRVFVEGLDVQKVLVPIGLTLKGHSLSIVYCSNR